MLERDRRKHPRRTVRYKAWIDTRMDKMIDCELVDISEGGAKVHVTNLVEVPDKFVLKFSLLGNPQRPCKVVWRGEDHIGVQFAAIAADAPIESVVEV